MKGISCPKNGTPLQGTIPASDVTSDMQALIGKYLELERKRTVEHTKKQHRRLTALAAPDFPKLHDKKIFVGKGVEVGPIEAWRKRLREMRARQVHDRLSADIYVVQDASEPGQRIRWCCFLGGRTACTLSYAWSAGERGSAVTYQRAISSNRKVWVSEGFKTRHTELYAIITALMHADGSRWALIGTREAFVTLGTKASGAGRGGEVVGFMTSGEQKQPDRRQLRNICWGVGYRHRVCVGKK